MWGPYSRTPYSRAWSVSRLFTQTTAGVYNVAAGFVAIRIALMTLAGKYLVNGYRLRTLPIKHLGGVVEYSASAVKQTGKIVTGSVIYGAVMLSISEFKRTLTGTYKIAGTIKKRMYVTLLGATVWLASRLKLQRVYGWDYTGDFAPGDTIEIDRDRLTVELNGVNALHLIDGTLPFFEPGVNTLIYSDGEGSRTVRIRVSWRGRWQ